MYAIFSNDLFEWVVYLRISKNLIPMHCSLPGVCNQQGMKYNNGLSLREEVP